MRKPLNLALQGGGAHGAFTWGVLDRLLEDGRLDLCGLSATSAGAMNAAVLAYGRMRGGSEAARAALERFWSEISRAGAIFNTDWWYPIDAALNVWGMPEGFAYHAFEAMTRLMSPYQFNPGNLSPVREVLAAQIDFEELRRSSDIRINICATNVRTGSLKVFANDEVSADAVMASACLPQLFQAVEIGGEFYWDGGYMANPAIFPLMNISEVTDILVVHVNPICRNTLPRLPSEIANRVNEVSFNSSLIRELRAIAFVTDLIDNGWIKDEFRDRLKRVLIHALRADDALGHLSVGSKSSTRWDFLTSLRDAGRAAAGGWLDQHFDAVGKRSTVDIRGDYSL